MRISFLEAVKMIKNGSVVALPTETVYGLAASIHQPEAIESIFNLKNRPRINPLIIHLANFEQISLYVETLPINFKELVDFFWPGPLTCILPIKKKSIHSNVTASLSTAGFRIPSLEITRQLIREVGPIVMPSANLSGRPSATTAEHVELDFGLNFPVLDAGSSEGGIESTIIYYDKSEWLILRQGAIPAEAFTSILKYQPRLIEKNLEKKPLSPGQLFRHYSPLTPLYLNPLENESHYSHILGFQERNYSHSKQFISLGSLYEPKGVAKNLYANLRLLDQKHSLGAWVDMDFPSFELWKTIAERLNRAAEKN